jgi:tetratricopeptide (TPR) repeat protein
MALIAYNEADLDTALAYNEKAVDLIIKLLGENHPNIATAYNNMGVIYDDLHNYSLALKFYFMAMEIREHAFGNRHAETIMSYKNIGAFFFERCDYINSLGYYNKALDAYKENADTENPEIEELKNTIEIVKNTMNGRQIEADYDSENSGFWSRFFRRK